MNFLVLLLLASPGDAPPIDVAQLAELQRHPVESYSCPKADGKAFAGMTRPKALELLGKPTSTSGPMGKGRDLRIDWRYRVTDGRNPNTSAYFTLTFGPGDVVHLVSCTDMSVKGGWTDVLIPYPEEPPKPDPQPATSEIHAILYSSRTKEEMLAALAKYVKPGDKLKHFERKSGMSDICVGTGTTTICMYRHAGLELVLDEKNKVRLIRRQKAQVDGKDYPEMSITAPGFSDEDHATWFEN